MRRVISSRRVTLVAAWFAAVTTSCVSSGPVARPRPLPRSVEAALGELADAGQHQDWRRIAQLLTPRCLAGCAGFVPRLLSGPEQGGGYQIARWVRRLQGGTLMSDLAAAVMSYQQVESFTLQPLQVRDYGADARLRVQLRASGVDREGYRRADSGLLDLSLSARGGGFRFERVTVVRVHTIRRIDPGYVPSRPARASLRSRVELAPSWWSLGQLAAGAPSVALDADGDGLAEVLEADVRGKLRWRGPSPGSVSVTPPPEVVGGVHALVAGDVDGDGRTDLFVVAREDGASAMWLNRTDGWRRAFSVPGVARAALLADLDGDGSVDVYVVRHSSLTRDERSSAGLANLLFLGDGAGRFERVVHAGDRGRGLCVCGGDFDGDGRIDLFVGNELSPAQLWINAGGGRFVDRTARSGLRVAGLATACATGDFDGDGQLDLFVGGVGASRGHLLGRGGRSLPGSGLLPDRAARRRIEQQRLGSSLWLGRTPGSGGRAARFEQAVHVDLRWVWRAVAFDHDNDGDLDLLVEHRTPDPALQSAFFERVVGPVAHGRRPRPLHPRGPRALDTGGALFVNGGRAALVEATTVAGLPARGPAASMVVLDAVSSDLALDLTGPGRARWSWQGGRGEPGEPGAHHAIVLRLQSRTRGNRDALGCRVELLAGGLKQVRLVGLASGLGPGGAPGHVHFGLGPRVRVDEVRVVWPDGQRERIVDLPVDRSVLLVQGQQPRWSEPAVADQQPDGRVAETAMPAPGAAATQPPETGARLDAWLWNALGPAAGELATVLLLAPAHCPGCPAACRLLAARVRRQRGVAFAVLGGRAPACAGARMVSVEEQQLRRIAPALPAVVLVDGSGQVVRVELDLPRPAQLEADLERLRR